VSDVEDRKLARWRATRDGALYACPHCWAGQAEPGRCRSCRRFDVAAVRGEYVPAEWNRPPLPVLARAHEEALARALKPRRRGAQPLP
jgi:hypothetical protein